MKTFEEIASELHMPVGTVTALYYRGLRKLVKQTPNAVSLLHEMAADLGRARSKRAARTTGQ